MKFCQLDQQLDRSAIGLCDAGRTHGKSRGAIPRAGFNLSSHLPQGDRRNDTLLAGMGLPVIEPVQGHNLPGNPGAVKPCGVARIEAPFSRECALEEYPGGWPLEVRPLPLRTAPLKAS